MTCHCIAIGIDAYKSPAWKLGACAADAIRFADWAIGSGGVDPSNLRMMVAPPGGAPAKVDLPDSGVRVANVAPTRKAIMALLLTEIRKRNWGASDRLYFYFAGHGCSHEWARGQRPEPVLFPLDVKELPIDSNLLLGFEDILSPLRAYGPRNQLIFIDACRDFALADYASTAGASVGRYLRPVLDDAGCAQNILYATAPGERSLELGSGYGVFATALLEGLNGHPAALQRLAGQTDYQLTFARLAAYVRKMVETRIRRFLLDTPYRYVQAPEIDPDARQPEFEIATIDAARVPPQPLHVRVTPGDKINEG
ncbi:putative caspase-like protein [Sinorhizobium kostiense]|uniref:Caspase-like protein n=1 Tax=Sinorhizobium kostiense TaxID=76747 RepID=A0ABS4R0A5_9HYPH|nr:MULTISPECIES: caspase family protein [Sinorhizobium]MBP2236320.1 putative caspase-like protein [Sinorhizobium kostiense]